MSQAVTMLEPSRLLDSASSSNLKIVFGDSRGKLDELSRSVVDEFRTDIFRLAESTLMNTTAANVDAFCNAWIQVQERFKNRSAALATFKTEFTNTLNFFIRDHRDELSDELQALVDKFDEELKQRNEVDEEILGRKAILEGWIADLRAFDVKSKSVAPAKKKRAARKTTAESSKPQSGG